jgi:acyl-CoA dehydrogenase
VLETNELRTLSAVEGALPSVMSSMMKVLGTELRQFLTELAVELEGVSACALRVNRPGAPWAEWEHGPMAMATYLNDRAASIYAGANEVQRNIIAGALLR